MGLPQFLEQQTSHPYPRGGTPSAEPTAQLSSSPLYCYCRSEPTVVKGRKSVFSENLKNPVFVIWQIQIKQQP